jgi:hypothetical protein
VGKVVGFFRKHLMPWTEPELIADNNPRHTDEPSPWRRKSHLLPAISNEGDLKPAGAPERVTFSDYAETLPE